MSDLILYDKQDHIATITFNRPEARNGVNQWMHTRFHDLLHETRDDPDVWIVVITGTGTAFCSGHDGSYVSSDSTNTTYQAVIETWKPTIAAINGECISQGTGIALACDIRIAVDIDGLFDYTQPRVGKTSLSGCIFLPQLMPMNLALEMLYAAEPMSSKRAFELGLLNAIVPSGQLEEATANMVRRIRANAPLPLRAMKQAAYRGQGMDYDGRIRLALGIFADAQVPKSDDAHEGRRATAEQRVPVWQGR
jgi:enoyl-CoA hydratase/carnithine racemase